MPVPNKQRAGFDSLETFLRTQEERLCTETAQRFASKPLPSSTEVPRLTPAEILAGARHLHQLVVVAAALYPSTITLNNELAWASEGYLPQRGITYEHLSVMFQAYFKIASDLLLPEGKERQALDRLEPFIIKTLNQIFNQGD